MNIVQLEAFVWGRSQILSLLVLVLASTAGCATAFEHTVCTAAEPSRLWAVWTDVEAWPEWDTELESATVDGPFEVGTKGILKPKDGPSSEFELVAVDPRRGYTYDVGLPLSHLRVARSSAPRDGILAVTHRVSFEGVLGWFFAGFLKGRYEEALPGVMEALASQAEAGTIERRPCGAPR